MMRKISILALVTIGTPLVGRQTLLAGEDIEESLFCKSGNVCEVSDEGLRNLGIEKPSEPRDFSVQRLVVSKEERPPIGLALIPTYAIRERKLKFKAPDRKGNKIHKRDIFKHRHPHKKHLSRKPWRNF